ncbi:MAG: LVIVD repeat-containing protein [Geminicoccaceae bacterium]
MTKHEAIQPPFRHPPANFFYDNQTDRENAIGFAATDVESFAVQLDNDTIWRLKSINPTVWTQVGGDGVGGGATGPTDSIQRNVAGVSTGVAGLLWDDTAKKLIAANIEQVAGTAALPYTPAIVATIAVGSNARNSVSLGNWLWVVDNSSNDLRCYDVTNPLVPELVSTFASGTAGRGVDVAGDFIYIADTGNPNRLRIIDVSNRAAPVIRGAVSVPLDVRGVKVQGNIALMTSNGTDVYSIDVTDPDRPVLLDTLTLSGNSLRIEFDISGNFAYFPLSGTADLLVVDISDPANMVEVGGASIHALASWAVKVVGRYAFFVDETTNNLKIFDVSDPPNISTTPVGTLDLGAGASPRALDVVGDFAYIVDAANNVLLVVDVSIPTAPVLISTAAPIGQNPVSITTVGRYAYITDNTDDLLQIVDLGGTSLQNLNVGNIDAGALNVRRDIKAAGEVRAGGGQFAKSMVSGDHAYAAGRRLGGAAANVVEVYHEDHFPDVAGVITPLNGVTYDVKAPITITKKLTLPVGGGAFAPAVIRSDAKYGNICTVNVASGHFVEALGAQGQLVLQNIRFEGDGNAAFADVSSLLNQPDALLELDDCDFTGFADGTKFLKCIFNANNATFWSGSGTIDLEDSECNLAGMFTADFVDPGTPVFRVYGSAGSTQPSFFTARNCKLSSQANQAFFMLHGNLPAGSAIRINGIEASPFTPQDGDFYATESGVVTGLSDSAGAPGVRIIVETVGHTVKAGDLVTLAGFTTETQMNATFVASDVLADSYEVVEVFNGTDSGTWSTASLTQLDRDRVNAFDNPGQEDGKSIGAAHVKGNATVTSIAVDNIWQEIDFGTVLAGSRISGWSLTDTSFGDLTYLVDDDFDAILVAQLSVVPDGGSPEFRFRAVKNGAVLADDVEAVVETTANEIANVSLVVPISVSQNDVIRLQVINIDDTNDLTVSNMSVVIQ